MLPHMRRMIWPTIVGLCAGGMGFAAGFFFRSASPNPPQVTMGPAPSVASQETEAALDKARRHRIATFPTVVMETPRTPDYSASPYPDWLVKVRCRGIPGDLKQDFVAVFQCVRGRAPFEAAGLHAKGMRLRLDMVPIEIDREPTSGGR